MNDALITAKHQIEIEDATAELIEFIKANPVKRNKSGSLNGNAVSALAAKWSDRFINNGENMSSHTIAYRVVAANA